MMQEHKSEDRGVIRRNVSLQPHDFQVVEAECEDSGLPFSTQLGLIIRQWSKLRPLLILARALDSGVITSHEAADRLALIAGSN